METFRFTLETYVYVLNQFMNECVICSIITRLQTIYLICQYFIFQRRTEVNVWYEVHGVIKVTFSVPSEGKEHRSNKFFLLL